MCHTDMCKADIHTFEGIYIYVEKCDCDGNPISPSPLEVLQQHPYQETLGLINFIDFERKSCTVHPTLRHHIKTDFKIGLSQYCPSI